MNIKQRVIKQLKQVKKRPITSEDIFQKYPQAMMFLGLAPSDYYQVAYREELGDAIKVHPGIYPIEAGQGLNGQSDRLDQAKLTTLINDTLNQQLPDLAPEDVDDMIEGSSMQMAGSTSSEWTSDHSYL